MYQYFNDNPKRRSANDCTVRAISRATGKTWEEIYMCLAIQGYKDGDMPSSNNVWESWLKAHGFKKYLVPDTCPDCYRVTDFAADYGTGTYIACTGDHTIAVVDGDYYDAWDSGNEIVTYYFAKEAD